MRGRISGIDVGPRQVRLYATPCKVGWHEGDGWPGSCQGSERFPQTDFFRVSQLSLSTCKRLIITAQGVMQVQARANPDCMQKHPYLQVWHARAAGGREGKGPHTHQVCRVHMHVRTSFAVQDDYVRARVWGACLRLARPHPTHLTWAGSRSRCCCRCRRGRPLPLAGCPSSSVSPPTSCRLNCTGTGAALPALAGPINAASSVSCSAAAAAAAQGLAGPRPSAAAAAAAASPLLAPAAAESKHSAPASGSSGVWMVELQVGHSWGRHPVHLQAQHCRSPSSRGTSCAPCTGRDKSPLASAQAELLKG